MTNYKVETLNATEMPQRLAVQASGLDSQLDESESGKLIATGLSNDPVWWEHLSHPTISLRIKADADSLNELAHSRDFSVGHVHASEYVLVTGSLRAWLSVLDGWISSRLDRLNTLADLISIQLLKWVPEVFQWWKDSKRVCA